MTGQRRTGRKVLQSVCLLTAWAALVSFGTFGAFTDLPSRAETVPITSEG